MPSPHTRPGEVPVDELLAVVKAARALLGRLDMLDVTTRAVAAEREALRDRLAKLDDKS